MQAETTRLRRPPVVLLVREVTRAAPRRNASMTCVLGEIRMASTSRLHLLLTASSSLEVDSLVLPAPARPLRDPTDRQISAELLTELTAVGVFDTLYGVVGPLRSRTQRCRQGPLVSAR